MAIYFPTYIINLAFIPLKQPAPATNKQTPSTSNIFITLIVKNSISSQ